MNPKKGNTLTPQQLAPWLILFIEPNVESCRSFSRQLEGARFEGHSILVTCVPDLQEAKQYLRQTPSLAQLWIGRLAETPEEGEMDLIYHLRETLGNYRTRIFPCRQNSRQTVLDGPLRNRFALEHPYDHLLVLDADLKQAVFQGLDTFEQYNAAISFDQHSPCCTAPLKGESACTITWKNLPGWPIESVSQSAARFFGYEPEEMENAQVYYRDLIAPGSLAKFTEARSAGPTAGQPVITEKYQVITKSGQLLWVFGCTEPECTTEGQTAFEVTTLFTNQVNQTIAPDLELDNRVGLVQIDQDQKIRQINLALAEVIGAGYPGVLDRDLSDWLEPADHQRLKQYLSITQITNQPQRFEMKIGPAGGRRPAEIYLSLSFLRESKNWGFQLLVELIEHREEKEKALKHELIQERAFIASASHELRTPLSAVLGYAELLKDAKGLDSEQQSFLNNIVTNSKHLVTLVNDILDLSKIESNQLSLNIEEVVFSDLFTSSGVMISSQVQEGVKLIVNAPDLAHFVLCDPVRIKQIFLNLLSNAAKFTAQGVIKIYLDVYQPIDANLFKVRICVEDTGAGIPKNRQQELFQPFKQVHAGSYGGTGLGLYLSQQIARLMDGQITLESDLGKGTTFFVDLVLTKGRVKGDQFAFDNKQILIFGDYPTLSDQQKSKLQKTGAKIDFIDCMDPRNHDRLRTAFSYDQVDLAILDVDILRDRTLWYAGALKETFPDISLVGLKREACQDDCQLLDLLLLKPFSYYQLASALEEEFDRFKPSMQLDYTKLKVLIVEDVEANRMLFSQMFQRFFNLVPSLAISGKDAVEQIRRTQFDLVYMDVEMPEMNGIDATKAIREFDQTTPIVAMTGNVFAEDIQATKDAGMTGFLSKPIQKEDLERTLSSLFKVEAAEPSLFADDEASAASQPGTAAQLAEGSPLEQMKASMLDHLSGLTDDRNALNEIVDTAVAEIQETFGRIVEYNGRNDQEGLRKSLHKLKGILLNMNVQPLGSRVQKLEEKMRDGDAGELLSEFIQQLLDLLKTS